MSQIGKSIDLYLMDGTASGRWQATLSNWNSIAYKIQRGDLKNCNDLPELNSPGVYFLFGRDDESDKQFVYVGEGDDVLKRIMQPHGFEKDDSYWTEAVIFITPDGSLNKATIKYLENRFYNLVVETNRYIVKNGNTPKQSPVQKKIRDMLEEFIINAKLVMPALGHKVFEPQPSANNDQEKEELLYFTRNNGKGGRATGKIADDGFWVLKGSYINPQTASYLPASLAKLRERYADDIDKNGNLKRDISFGSPSYASSFVCGKNSNGLVEWKDANGTTLKELNGDTSGISKKKKAPAAAVVIESEDTKINVDIDEADSERLHLASRVTAYAYALSDGFLVKKGSQFSATERKSCGNGVREQRKALLDEGKVVDGLFVMDVKFSSPSTAAACIVGGESNGRTMWVNDEGKTLKELQEMELTNNGKPNE